jgi:hypothetical protein
VADLEGALSTVMALLPGSSVNSSTSIAAADPAAVLLLSSIAVSLRTFFCAIRFSGLSCNELEYDARASSRWPSSVSALPIRLSVSSSVPWRSTSA